MTPIYHSSAPRSTNTGPPTALGLNAFHWRAEIEGREVHTKPARSKPGPKPKLTAAQKTVATLAFKPGYLSISTDPQADADKTSRIAGRKNSSRSS